MCKLLTIKILATFLCGNLYSQVPLTSSQKTHRKAGDILLYSMPTLAFGSTLIWKDGQKGTYQFSKALAGTIALSYGLKLAINKERPNGRKQ